MENSRCEASYHKLLTKPAAALPHRQHGKSLMTGLRGVRETHCKGLNVSHFVHSLQVPYPQQEHSKSKSLNLISIPSISVKDAQGSLLGCLLLGLLISGLVSLWAHFPLLLPLPFVSEQEDFILLKLQAAIQGMSCCQKAWCFSQARGAKQCVRSSLLVGTQKHFALPPSFCSEADMTLTVDEQWIFLNCPHP